MDSKTRSIVAYLTIIGWVISLVTNNPKDEQTTFHLRQALGIHLAAFLSGFLFWIPLIGWLLGIALLVAWIVGFTGAIEGTRSPLPYVGAYFQDWFKGL